MKKEIVLGKVIQRELERKGITQTALSNKCDMRNSTLHSYLYGSLPKGLIGLLKIADYFELSLDELLFDRSESEHDKLLKELVGKYVITFSKKINS